MINWTTPTCPMWFISMNHIGTMVFACGKHMICIRNCTDCNRESRHDHMMSMEQLHDTALTNQGQTYAKDMTIAVRRALGGLRRDVRCDMRGAKQKGSQVCVSTVKPC